MSTVPGPGAQPSTGRPSALGPLVRLLVRGLLGRRRSLGVVLLAAAPVLVAAVFAFGGGLGSVETLALEVFATITLGLVIPLAALILGTGALGTHVDDGTIVYLLVKPIARRTVVLAAMLVAGVAAAALTATGTLVSGLLLLGPGQVELQVGMVLAAGLAAVLYAAVFVALSVFTGRALLVGLGYVLIWEGFVTGLLPGTRILSIREYALAVAQAFSGSPPAEPGGGVELPVALILSGAVLVLSFLLASWRLGRFEVADAG